jgi:glycosyltransferase involved in cell wall biosynthesis
VPAPIALFAYRRPQHLERTIEALTANPDARDSLLYVFSDGPKDEAAGESVGQVRRLIERVNGFAGVRIVLRDRNLGLARNITSGVSEVLGGHDTVIVVEDDIVVSPFFLRFMNDALSGYRDEPRVGSISGYCYPVARTAPETYFIRGADCWGWATWRDRWQFFNPDGRALLQQLRSRNLTQAFDFDGAMGFTQMLEDQINGKNDSWAVRWHASCFLRGLQILYPGRALAANIGIDGSGTHCIGSDPVFDVNLSPTPVSADALPVEESAAMRQAIREFFLQKYQRGSGGGSRSVDPNANPPSLLSRIRNKVRDRLRRM